jgi:hypothetical protein
VRVTIARTGKEVTLVKGRRHTPEQVVRKLREADRLLAEGADLEGVCRHLEISIQTYQAGARSTRRCGRRTWCG